MKNIFLFILLISNSSLAQTLNVGAASREQFVVQEHKLTDGSIDPLKLDITTLHNNKTYILPFAHTPTQFQKLNFSPDVKNGKANSFEILLVVTDMGSKLLGVEVYVPVMPGSLLTSQKINVACRYKNHGDFSWDDSAGLLERIRLNQATQELELKLGTPNKNKNGDRELVWKSCFSFSNKKSH